MTQADLERRVRELEDALAGLHAEVQRLSRGQVVLETAVSLARWFGPFVVSVAAVVIVLVKG